MDTAQAVRMMTLFSHACLLLCHPTSWRTHHQTQPMFLPGPQFCPDTGRTVCAAVDYYPTDQVYHLLTNARSQIFNLTSLFVDERKGDVEPNLAQLPTLPSFFRDGYGGNQPPPGGRFSPAGFNNWNRETSDKPPNYSGQQRERWRATPPNNINGNNGQLRSVVSNPNGSRRQSRAQDFSNQRRNSNYDKIPIEAAKYDVQSKQQDSGENFQEINHGVTQHNRVESYNINNGFNISPAYPGSNNSTGFHSQDVQRSQEPYQIQPPYMQQRSVKGYGMYPTMSARPQPTGNWKGSPSYIQYTKSPSGAREPMEAKFIRRERRNEDVEVACQVQSTFVPPRAALSDNSEWKYIVNVPERDRRFSQVVRVDVCMNEGQPCSSRLSLPFGFESRCRQKYIKKKLLSLNADGQGTSEDNFFIPSCCVCEITRPNKKK